MKMMLVKTERGLRGVTDEDHQIYIRFKQKLERMEVGEYLSIETKRPRHPGHHRKLFALLRLIADNSETYNTIQRALYAIKVVTGYTHPVIDPLTGELTNVPDSISYASMDQDRFNEFYSHAIDGVLQHLLPGMPRQKFDRLLDIVISGWA